MRRKDDAELLKEQLDNEAKQLEDEIKSEVAQLKRSAQKTLKNVLLISGGAIIVYSILKLILSDKKKIDTTEEKIKHRSESTISSRIKSVALTLALEMAKKKLTNLINKKSDDSGKPEEK